jgi:hypothetical protein
VHNDGNHNLYSSTNVIEMIQSRRIRLAGHVEHMREMIFFLKEDPIYLQSVIIHSANGGKVR